MSAPFTVQTITTAGNAMSASAWAASGIITITSIQFGSGFPGVSDNVPAYTTLKTPIVNGQITGENVLIAGQCTIRANLAGTSIPSTFQINEMGVFASFAGGASQLVAYMSTGSAVGDTLTVGSPVVKDYAILVTFSQGVITTVNISLLQTVGLHAPNHLDNGIDPIPYPSTARAGLLLANPNNATMGLIGTNPPSWVPVLKVLTVNTTLYVATTGNDSTALPNDPAHPWLTIQGALNFLTPYFILPSISINISVAAGNYAITSQINVTHPQGAQITIIGPSVATTTILSVSVTGSAGNWSVTYNVASATGLSVNTWILVRSIPGIVNSDEGLISGAFIITSISGTAVTCHNPYTGASFPSMAAINFGVIQPITAIVNVGGTGEDAFNIGTSLGQLERIGMTSTIGGTFNYGVVIAQGGTVNCAQIFVSGFGDNTGTVQGGGGISVSASAVASVVSSAMTQCSIGYISEIGASISITQSYAHTCHFGAYYAVSGGFMSVLTLSYAVGGDVYGVVADNASNITFGGFVSSIRNEIGILSNGSSVIRLSEPGTTVVAVNNSTDDLAVQVGSYITGVANIIHNTQGSPSNVLTADGSLIS